MGRQLILSLEIFWKFHKEGDDVVHRENIQEIIIILSLKPHISKEDQLFPEYWHKNAIKNRIKYNNSTNTTKNHIKISYISYVNIIS
jgi:hypothetical protein